MIVTGVVLLHAFAGAAPGSRTVALHSDFGTADPVNTQFV